MRRVHTRALLALALLAGLTVPVAAASSDGSSKPSATASSKSQARKTKAPRLPVNTGYGENRKERDQRLLRECRGKPNAGACEGYAN